MLDNGNDLKNNQVDMLLLNCSNLAWRPIFPYAFVQVSEIASRFGLKVMCLDLLRIENWSQKIRELNDQHNFRAIGVHLRQGDSIDLSDYLTVDKPKNKYYRTYYPIDDSKLLIETLKKITKAPIIMGGFGFTTHAKKIASYLELELGVQGCPDGFFNNFESIISGRNLTDAPGLVYSDGSDYIYNKQILYNPSENTEYNDNIVNELKLFYGDELNKENPPTIAIEISRGCPFQCYFCTEPDIKGKRVNYRNQDVIISEIEFLLRKGLYDFWFICSEINIGGTRFILELAEKIVRLNEKYSRKKIKWSGYSLPTLKHDELELLMRSGYSGAMNDIISLDQKNLTAARVPYKKDQAISFLKSLISLRDSSKNIGINENEEVKFTASTPSEYSGLLSFFLGNAHANENTIAVTLDEINKNGLSHHYDEGYVIPSTRVFSLGRTSEFVERKTTISITKNGLTDPNTLLPTFYFPEFLVDKLGTREEVMMLFEYVGSTFMSSSHKKKWDFSEFIHRRIDHKCVNELIYKSRSGDYFGSIFDDDIHDNNLNIKNSILDNKSKFSNIETYKINKILHEELKMLFKKNYREISGILHCIGDDYFDKSELIVNEYVFTKYIYKNYHSIDDLFKKTSVLSPDVSGVIKVYLEYLIYITNIIIKPKYKELLFNY